MAAPIHVTNLERVTELLARIRDEKGDAIARTGAIVVDTKVLLGDAIMKLDDVVEKVAPVPTFVNACAMNTTILGAIAELARRGIEPPTWRSSNSRGGDEAIIGPSGCCPPRSRTSRAS